jgi:hypothetical protein
MLFRNSKVNRVKVIETVSSEGLEMEIMKIGSEEKIIDLQYSVYKVGGAINHYSALLLLGDKNES